ncbi:hypothetical protein JCM21714_553 [Gracilibacillus boraciitolerans JCM 21714]|uniref:Flagellar Assembly Protein A N-terminal region domain-containing protein n=1 Tax=Gracilibacillus boraciitolerans JCM 21714 TaxID=1298598 RepID=W4VDW2_9BACI|nr:FapA family protein [Gracilibacillus boraciitolerans]GAE91600.1 hypothetical protein JCM21714_553 [Gracilibacillus boraciitolerans JCM 21714]
MSALEEIKEKIDLKIDEDQLTATLFLVNEEQAENISIEEINLLIEEYNLLYGIIDMHSSGWQQKLIDNYQFVIAQGKKPENGKHGSLIVKQSTENELSEEEKTNFRDVTKIPMVEANDLLAQLIPPPTDGEPGIDIFNQPIKQKKGKPFKCRAGKNVTFNEKDQTYIASTNGQLSIGDHILNVFPLYEIPGDLSLKTGNIDFNGSVTIRGNIPTGFKVIAKGDVIVYGIVEASYIDAGGNIFISEGVAGMDKAIIKAGTKY